MCPLRFWANHGHKFPAMAVMAEWIFGIPPTSTRAESLFSSSGGILTSTRGCLSPDNAEQLSFLWANSRASDYAGINASHLKPNANLSGTSRVVTGGSVCEEGKEGNEGGSVGESGL